MKPVVHVIDQAGYEMEDIRVKSRLAFESDGIEVRGRSVFVKPSFVYPARPPLNRGVNTQPEVVGGVVRALRDLGASRVWVGEDCLVGPSQCAFTAMGLMPYLRGFADPVFLQDEERVEVKVEPALVEGCFSMPRRLMDADLFVSLPKLKVNMYATVTLSVKNHVGLLLAADRLTNHHYNIHKKIADLYRARIPDYVIADSVLAGEGQGPMHAEPSPLHVLVAGANGVAVDAVSCRLMGYEPEEIEHLALLGEMGVGPLDLSEIEIDGKELFASRRRRLARPMTSFDDYHHSVRIVVGKELACPEGCAGMIRGSLDRWASVRRWKPLKGYTFIVGKGAEIPPDLVRKKTVVVGDCAAEHAHLGLFLPGCPIPPLALTYALARRGVWGPLYSGLGDLAHGWAVKKLGLRLR